MDSNEPGPSEPEKNETSSTNYSLEDLLKIKSATDLVNIYLSKIKTYSKEKYHQQMTNALNNSLTKTTEKFQKSSPCRSLLRNAIQNINSANWKDSFKELQEELKSHEPGDIETSKKLLAKCGEKKVEDHIKRLTKRLAAINKKIRKLELTEVDPENTDEEEVMINLEHQLKKKAVKLHLELRRVQGENRQFCRANESSIKVEIDLLKQHPKLLQKALKLVNNKTRRDMPTLEDFKKVVKEYKEKYKTETSDWNPKKTKLLCDKMFKVIGLKWQERRGRDFAEDFAFFGSTKPVEDEDLKLKLKENRKQEKKVTKLIEEFVAKQEDFELNGDENIKKEYLEETDEQAMRREDAEEQKFSDGIKVEHLEDEDDVGPGSSKEPLLIEKEIELVDCESDYQHSLASDSEGEPDGEPEVEPEGVPNGHEPEDGQEEIEMEAENEQESGSLEEKSTEQLEPSGENSNPLEENSTEELSEKENNAPEASKSSIERTMSKFTAILRQTVETKAPKHIENIPASIDYLTKRIETSQKLNLDEEFICVTVENVSTQLEAGLVTWKESIKEIASRIKEGRGKKRVLLKAKLPEETPAKVPKLVPNAQKPSDDDIIDLT